MWAKIKPFLLILIPFITVIIFSNYLQVFVLSNQDQVTRWLESFGPFIVLAYVLLQFISIVIAPVGGFVLVVVMIALFGPGVALALNYLVSAPTYLLNFYLARRYGRPYVERIIGKETLQKLDRYVEDAGLSTLIILRTFQGSNFDYLSYVFGLTKIPFRNFTVVNFLAGIPGTIVTYLVLRRFNDLTTGIIALYAVIVIFLAIALLLKYFRKRNISS